MATLDQRTWSFIRNVTDSKLTAEDRKNAALYYLQQAKFQKDPTAQRLIAEISSRPDVVIPQKLQGIIQRGEDLRQRVTILTDSQEKIVEDLSAIYRNSVQLGEKGIVFAMTILLLGEPGTGKTLFAAELAKRMKLPFFYVNMSYLVDSLLGKTGQNLQECISFASAVPCVMMLDELDAIAMERHNEGSCSREAARILISLMQGLDQLGNGNIIISATNRYDLIDPAIKRRFLLTYTFENLSPEEAEKMLRGYLKEIRVEAAAFTAEDIRQLVGEKVNPAKLISAINQDLIINWPADPDVRRALNTKISINRNLGG